MKINRCFLTALVVFSPLLQASTSVLNGPHWWRETAEVASPSPLYSLEGDQAWWRGQTLFSGSVIEPACLVTIDDAWQSVLISKSKKDDLSVYEAPFSLTLGDCDMVNSSFSSGSRIKARFYKFSDSATAVNNNLYYDVQLITGNGEIFQEGQLLPSAQVTPVLRSINYILRFKSNTDTTRNKNKNMTLSILVLQE